MRQIKKKILKQNKKKQVNLPWGVYIYIYIEREREREIEIEREILNWKNLRCDKN